MQIQLAITWDSFINEVVPKLPEPSYLGEVYKVRMFMNRNADLASDQQFWTDLYFNAKEVQGPIDPTTNLPTIVLRWCYYDLLV